MESQAPGTVWVGRDFKDPPQGRDPFRYPGALQAPSSLALGTSRRPGAATAPRGLCQGLGGSGKLQGKGNAVRPGAVRGQRDGTRWAQPLEPGSRERSARCCRRAPECGLGGFPWAIPHGLLRREPEAPFPAGLPGCIPARIGAPGSFPRLSQLGFPGSASEPCGDRSDLAMEMGLTGIFPTSRIIFLPCWGWELLRMGAGVIFPEKWLLPLARLFCWEAQLGGNERHFVAALSPRIFPPFQKIP